MHSVPFLSVIEGACGPILICKSKDTTGAANAQLTYVHKEYQCKCKAAQILGRSSIAEDPCLCFDVTFICLGKTIVN